MELDRVDNERLSLPGSKTRGSLILLTSPANFDRAVAREMPELIGFDGVVVEVSVAHIITLMLF